MLVQSFDAAREQVTGIKIVSRGPLEELLGGLSEHKVVVRDRADVGRLAEELDSRITGGVRAADVVRPVRRGIARDDQFKVLECLAEQRVQGLARKSAPLYTGKPMLSLGLLMRSNSFVADSERLPRRQNRTMANLGVRSGHADVAFRGARLYIWFRCRAGNSRNAHDRE